VSLRHILLGLAESECSGYDVKKAFDTSLRNFWRAELSQIYPQLQKLERDGLLESEKAESAHGPQRVVYRRTEAGEAALKQWLDGGPVVATERIAFLAQVYFLHELENDEQRLEFMRMLRDYFEARVEHLQSIHDQWSEKIEGFPDALADEEFYPQLTLSCGLHRTNATLAWCDETIEKIERRAADQAPPAKPTCRHAS
jgi:PadR family transcriptional regulator AphA